MSKCAQKRFQPVSLNCIIFCKPTGCNPILPPSDNSSPFYRSVWRCDSILSDDQNNVQQRCDRGRHHDRAVNDHLTPFSYWIYEGCRSLYFFFSARYVTHARSRFYQPVRHDLWCTTTARATQAVISSDIRMFFCAPAVHL